MSLKEEILKICPNTKFDEPMKNNTTFKIGGNADVFCEPESVWELQELLKLLKTNNIKPMVIGNGSNLLVKDNGIRGVVIKIGEKMSNVKVDKNKVEAEAGILLSRLSNFILKNSLKGFECMSGIPGTLGGAVFMNAGAYGGEMSQVVAEVTAMDENGEIKTFKKDELMFGYRKSVFNKNNMIIVSCVLELEKGNKDEIEAKIKELTRQRCEKQPLNFPSAGSTFKRPEGYFAGKLIEDCNLKGFRVGGAKISEKHAGFVINSDNATAKDVLDLMDRVMEKVFSEFGVKMEPEVKIIGEE